MKRIVRNYVVRDPKPIMDAIIGGVNKYKAISITPSVDGQLIFEEIVGVIIGDIEKTELYINGVRYNHGTDYTIENNKLIWLGDFEIKVTNKIVFICR